MRCPFCAADLLNPSSYCPNCGGLVVERPQSQREPSNPPLDALSPGIPQPPRTRIHRSKRRSEFAPTRLRRAVGNQKSEKLSLRLHALLNMYDHNASQILLLMSKNEKVIGLGFTALALAITSGIAAKIREVFLFVPPSVVAVGIYATFLYNMMAAAGGTNKALEDMINGLLNDEVGRPVAIWETVISEKFAQRSKPTISFLIVFVLVSVVSILFCFGKVLQDFGKKILILDAIAVGVLVALLAVCVWEMIHTYANSYDVARSALRLTSNSNSKTPA
jgi:hypothetical protein